MNVRAVWLRVLRLLRWLRAWLPVRHGRLVEVQRRADADAAELRELLGEVRGNLQRADHLAERRLLRLERHAVTKDGGRPLERIPGTKL